MTIEKNLLEAIKKIRSEKDKKRNFDETVDLIVNLKEFDVRREAFNVFITLPYKIKDKKIMGFFEKKSKIINSITKDEFSQFQAKKDIRKLLKGYDFFIANARLMPSIATTFGRVLGPSGKMPSPQLGISLSEDDKTIEDTVRKINSTVRVRVKEPSIKIGIAKESLKDEEIMQNALAAYNKVLETLPRKKDNIKNVKIKLTMGKPVVVEV